MPRMPQGTTLARPTRTARPVWLYVAAAVVGGAVLIRVLVGGAEVLPAALQDAVTLAASVLIESLPYVILGILLSILVQVWLPANLVDRLLPRTPWLRRVVLSLTGVLVPVCECGNVPLARGLIARGLAPAEAITFLLAAPILNPVTILTTYQAFGWADGILVARILGGFLIANLLGWVFSRQRDPSAVLTPAFAASCEAHREERSSRWRRSLTMFAEESSALLPALLVGSALAGAIQVGVPRAFLEALGSDPVWSVLALMALAFIMSVCSTVDAFVMLAFAGLFLPGGIAAFLVFGAMIDVKMLALLRTTFRTSTVVQIALVVALSSLVIGLGVNVLA